MPIIELDIEGMTCGACAQTVENALKKVQIDGVEVVETAAVSVINKKASIVVLEISSERPRQKMMAALLSAVDDVGFKAQDAEEPQALIESTPEFNEGPLLELSDVEIRCEGIDGDGIHQDIRPEIVGPTLPSKSVKKKARIKQAIRYRKLRGAVGTVAGFAMMFISMYAMAFFPCWVMYLLGAAATLLTLYLGKECYHDAFVQMKKNKRLTMDSLFTVSTSVALVVSCFSFFFPVLPMMFDAALLILGFKNIGKAIEESTNQKLSKASFVAEAPQTAFIERPSTSKATRPLSIQQGAVKNLVLGDVIIVYTGQTVPVDGKFINAKYNKGRPSEDTEDLTASASIYNTVYSGRLDPQPLNADGPIYAGSVVPGHIKFIRMRVSATVENSYLAGVDRLLKQAALEKSKIEENVQSAIQYFVPTIFAIALLSVILVSALLSPIAAVQCGVTLLGSACPCGLGLITPWALLKGRIKAARYGAMVKNGKSLLAATNIDTVVFDLTGTLTTGKPKVIFCSVPKSMLSFLAAIEEKIDHCVPKAIYHYVEDAKLMAPFNVEINEMYHVGAVATINQDEFIVGNAKMMLKKNIDISQFQEGLATKDYDHVVYFVKNKEVVGHLLLEDPLREDALPLINCLKKMNKEVHLCTGADEPTARKQALRLGIPIANVRADCEHEKLEGKPFQYVQDRKANTKSNYVRYLTEEKKRHVATIGDDKNDAVAIQYSQFGVAVKSESGSAVTQAAADALVNPGSLNAIANVFVVAEQTDANIKQNLVANLLYNLLAVIAFSGLLVTLGFVLNPAIGAALMIAQIVLIIMNVERFNRQPVAPLEHIKGQESVNTRQIKRRFQLRPESRPLAPSMLSTQKNQRFNDASVPKTTFAPDTEKTLQSSGSPRRTLR